MLEGGDPFGSGLELLEVGLRVAFVGGAVADDGEALPQGVGEFTVDRRGGSRGVHGEMRAVEVEKFAGSFFHTEELPVAYRSGE